MDRTAVTDTIHPAQAEGVVNPKRLSQLAVPIGVVAIILMMVVPVPSALLDFLIAINITGALLIVLVSMYVQRPLDFSSFPSLLLVATLFRLALNISATRAVLGNGYAGRVINAFGHFVVGGSLIIGLVIFAILLVIQFVVITNGAGRVAEVGARFTLDAMPGKQMAIDADLNSGLIDEATARRRRLEVASEADFYGSMDGASKFVKGDAIAAIIITVINLVGGIAIGILQHHLSVQEALNKYSLLSIGDGLVSQIPALLLSVSTGLIVTRAGGSADLGTIVAAQLGGQKKALQIAGGAALALCLVPGLPKLPFLAVGGGAALPRSAAGQVRYGSRAGRSRAAAGRGRTRSGQPGGHSERPVGRSARALALLGHDLAGRRGRRRPARSGPGAAPQAGPGTGRGHAAGPHPRQRRSARRHLRHPGQRRRGRPRQGADRHRTGPRRRLGQPARPGRSGTGLRLARQVDQPRAARPGRTARRHRGRPFVGHHHAPVRDRPDPRQPAARPRGGLRPDPVAEEDPSGRGGGPDPGRAEPGRDPAGAARPAGGGRLHSRPGPDLRSACRWRPRPAPNRTGWSRRRGRHWRRPSPLPTPSTAPCRCSRSTRGCSRACSNRSVRPRPASSCCPGPRSSRPWSPTWRRSTSECWNEGMRPVLACAPQIRLPLRRLVAATAPDLPVLSYTEISSNAKSVDSVGVIGNARTVGV